MEAATWTCLGLCLLIAAATGPLYAAEPPATPKAQPPADDYPQLSLANGLVKLKLYLPDETKGYYRGSRFEASGVVARAEFKGHTFFGPWHRRHNPTGQDAIEGTAEEFCMERALGFDEVEAGGEFYKIGVGALIKKEKPARNKETGEMEPAKYGFWLGHTIARHAGWKITHGPDWVQFVQDFSGERGWGWHYTKRVSLLKGKPVFTIARTLKNTGAKAMDTEHYCHNFTLIDNEPVGPAYLIRFPFELSAAQKFKGTAAGVKGHELVVPDLTGDTVWAELEGPTGKVEDNAVLIRNRKTGAGLSIVGDRAPLMMRFWATRLAACPEPFVAVKLAPGEAMSWQNTYTLQVDKAEK